MDGVQRNFSMMAEKIDRMRCLRVSHFKLFINFFLNTFLLK